MLDLFLIYDILSAVRRDEMDFLGEFLLTFEMLSNTSYAWYKRKVTGSVLGLNYVAWLTPSVFGNFKNVWGESKRCTGS